MGGQSQASRCSLLAFRRRLCRLRSKSTEQMDPMLQKAKMSQRQKKPFLHPPRWWRKGLHLSTRTAGGPRYQQLTHPEQLKFKWPKVNEAEAEGKLDTDLIETLEGSWPAPRLQGSKASRLQGSKGPRLQGSTAPRLQGSKASLKERKEAVQR